MFLKFTNTKQRMRISVEILKKIQRGAIFLPWVARVQYFWIAEL